MSKNHPVLYRYLRWLILLGFILAYPLSQFLPIAASWENGSIEWLQAAVLFINFLGSLWFAKLTASSTQRWLWLTFAPVWLIMFGRETNWGAAFFPPLEIGANGPVLLPTEALWYGSFIYPLLAIFLFSALFMFIKNKSFKTLQILFHKNTFPWLEFALTILAMIISSLSEDHAFTIPGGRNQLFEEYLELIFYAGLLLNQIYLYLQLSTKKLTVK